MRPLAGAQDLDGGHGHGHAHAVAVHVVRVDDALVGDDVFVARVVEVDVAADARLEVLAPALAEVELVVLAAAVGPEPLALGLEARPRGEHLRGRRSVVALDDECRVRG